MIPFDFQPRTRLVFGVGTLARLGDLARELGGSRVLLVSDPGIERAGHVARACDSLRKAGLECGLFTAVEENPTTKHVAAAVEAARKANADFLVGLGGGSSMDTAKGANFILTNGGRMQDYWGSGRAGKPMLPMIAIPTTAGTGSEAQSYALIADETTHAKMACGDPKAACRAAILDPALTVSQPREVAALTGMDAISHALETWVTRPRNEISALFSRRAWELLSENYPKVFSNPGDLEARGSMLLGAFFAGLAIEHSMLGATHSLANPVTARFGTTHGRAIGILLPHVIRKNGEEVGPLYAELLGAAKNGSAPRGENHAAGPGENYAGQNHAGERLAGEVERLRNVGGLPSRLGECGVDRAALPEMAREAAAQWTARFNPREFSEREFLELYECAF